MIHIWGRGNQDADCGDGGVRVNSSGNALDIVPFNGVFLEEYDDRIEEGACEEGF